MPGTLARLLRSLALTALLIGTAQSSPCLALDVADANDVAIAVTVSPERVQWGDEIEISIVASNRAGRAVRGGVYVSFDQDVLVIDAKGGQIERPGSAQFNLSSLKSEAIARPMVVGWFDDWKAGVEQHIAVTVLPLRGPRLRAQARVTLVDTSGGQTRMWLAPGRMSSRSLDQTGFPTQVGYAWISQKSTLRRAVRRFERRVKALGSDDQIKFALALADALDDPKSFAEFAPLRENASQSPEMSGVAEFAPRIAQRLRDDSLVALEKLRCVMASLDCRDALVYFGVPMAVFEERSDEELASLEAQRSIDGEPGADMLVLLLEAQGLRLEKDAKTGELIVRVAGKAVKAGPQGPMVRPLLKQLVETLGPDAHRPQATVNGLSFASLSAQLEVTTGGLPR